MRGLVSVTCRLTSTLFSGASALILPASPLAVSPWGSCPLPRSCAITALVTLGELAMLV